MRLIQALAVCAALVILISGIGFGGYVLSKRITSVPCYGCMALNPKFTPFKGFSTENVSHPDWVIDTLKDENIVFIFLWQIGCDPCEAQWNDMKNAGIVKGFEENGEIGDKYNDEVKLFSLDAGSITDQRGEEAMNIYNLGGGTPTTIILTLVKDNETNEVKIGWYSFMGYQSGKPMMSNLEQIIESGIYYYDENKAQWAT